ncbi:hypothetical protein MRX96_009861 [Rhipicephalus microplus]
MRKLNDFSHGDPEINTTDDNLINEYHLSNKAAPRLEAAIVRCSSSTECCQEFPAADPDRSGWNPTLQVPDSATVFDLKIPPPDLRPEIRPSRSSSEDIEALNSIVLDTTEPYQTTIMLSHADTRLPRNVSFEKAQIPSYAEATAIENLPRTSPPAVSSQHTMFAHDSSPEATGSTTSGSSAVARSAPPTCSKAVDKADYSTPGCLGVCHDTHEKGAF